MYDDTIDDGIVKSIENNNNTRQDVCVPAYGYT